MVSKPTKNKDVSKYINDRNKLIDEFYNLKYGRDVSNESVVKANQDFTKLLEHQPFMYKYYHGEMAFNRVLRSLKLKKYPTIKFTQGNKICDVNDHDDCRIRDVYKYIIELRKSMVEELETVLCRELDTSRCLDCRNQLRKSLEIKDWVDWYHNIAEINIEFQDGVTESVCDIVSNGVDKFNHAHDEYIKNSLKCIGVFCLCERHDSEYMWEGEFGDNHKGFCIAYSMNELQKICGSNMIFLPVHYIDNDDHLFELTCRFFNSNFNKIHKLNKIEDCNLATKTVYTKNTYFSEEFEWRLTTIFKKYKPNGEPFKREQFFRPRPSAIYLGKDIENKLETEIRELCKKNGISVYKMKLSDSDDWLDVGD